MRTRALSLPRGRTSSNVPPPIPWKMPPLPPHNRTRAHRAMTSCASCAKAGDPSRGRQTPDPLGARALRVASMSSDEGRAGAQITQAAGFAWAAKMKREDLVTLVYFDERATEGGEFHNGANFAGVFKTPLVLFCRNGASQSMPIADKGVAYALPSVPCDGTDLFAVYKVTRDAVERARGGGGPTLIEAITPRAPLADRARDPIAR